LTPHIRSPPILHRLLTICQQNCIVFKYGLRRWPRRRLCGLAGSGIRQKSTLGRLRRFQGLVGGAKPRPLFPPPGRGRGDKGRDQKRPRENRPGGSRGASRGGRPTGAGAQKAQTRDARVTRPGPGGRSPPARPIGRNGAQLAQRGGHGQPPTRGECGFPRRIAAARRFLRGENPPPPPGKITRAWPAIHCPAGAGFKRS
jgi:hypothetical protein